MVEIRFTKPFQRRFKALAKRYRQIKKDIQPILTELQAGNFIGDRIIGIGDTVFKVRAANSDIPVGKSGGYRLIYQVVCSTCVFLLLIYAKSDQVDVTADEIRDAINQAF
ncbi:MAG TPA: addiction module antitoxin [Cyanobacteria bacterium UBA12227]|nr:addiction module antitoxin [Cyanobacteria bacterium UBA12227]HAX89250.1 addiction module antitoxin [Cyanobacteria bacterium UBA11370]HBY75509.1 addiction module antitoxin [Cyanobacteria bacterium UBA11148]